MKYKAGDTVKFPGAGVCEVLRIESKKFGAESNDFYVLKGVSSNSTVFVPCSDPNNRIQPLPSKKDIDTAFQIMKSKPDGDLKFGTRMQRRIRESLKSGSIFSHAEAIRDLVAIGEFREMSKTERGLLSTLIETVVPDVSAVTQQSPEEAKACIESKLGLNNKIAA